MNRNQLVLFVSRNDGSNVSEPHYHECKRLWEDEDAVEVIPIHVIIACAYEQIYANHDLQEIESAEMKPSLIRQHQERVHESSSGLPLLDLEPESLGGTSVGFGLQRVSQLLSHYPFVHSPCFQQSDENSFASVQGHDVLEQHPEDYEMNGTATEYIQVEISTYQMEEAEFGVLADLGVATALMMVMAVGTYMRPHLGIMTSGKKTERGITAQ